MARARVLRGLRAWVLALCWVGGSACGDGDDSEGCFIKLEDEEASQAGTLVYTVSVSSSLAQVFKIVYAAPDGEKIVENPTLPFSVSLQVQAGDSVHLAVTGAADRGSSLSAGYSFGTVANSETCQH